MRVLHLTSGNLYGGVERMLVTLAEQQAYAPDMKPHFGACFEGQVTRELREAGAAVHLLADGVRFSRPWTVIAARLRLKRLLLRESYDIVACHSAWPHALFAAAVRSAGVPLVFWAHDASDGRHWLHRLAGRVPPDLAIANSRFTMTSVPQTFAGVHTEVVYCPVAPPTRDWREQRRALRSEVGTAPDTIVIVLGSRLEEWKGHRVLIAALKQLSNVPAYECWIAGGAQRPAEEVYLQKLRADARDLPVKFLGQRSDMPRVLAAADIHCQPNSGAEPFGVAFVEALYAGLPVVATRIGGAVEILTPDCGVLIEPGDATELASALRRLIVSSDARTQLSVHGPARAEELCHPRIVLPMLHAKLRAVEARSLSQAGTAS